jgi:hypothetical protein
VEEATGAGVFGVVDEDVVVLTGAVVDAPGAVAWVDVGVAGIVVVVGVVVMVVDVGVVDADVEVGVVAEAGEFINCEASLPCRPNPCRLLC